MTMVEMVARAIVSARPLPTIINPQAHQNENWQSMVPEACAAIEMITALQRAAKAPIPDYIEYNKENPSIQ